MEEVKKQHFYWLDAIRFLAAFMVVFCHSRNDFFLPYGELPECQQNYYSMAFYSLGRLAHEAVIVFFVLSGFLVGGPGLKRIFTNQFNLKGYVIDRTVRIYLPLIVSIILFFFTCLFLGLPFDWLCALGNLLNLQESIVEPLVSPYWSLAYEMWFYISIAALFLIIRNKRGKVIGLTLMGMLGVVFVCGLDFFYFFMWLLGAFSYLTIPAKGNKLILFLSGLFIIISIILTQSLSNSHSMSITLLWLSNYKLAELLLTCSLAIFIQQVILFPPKRKIAIFIEKHVGNLAKFSYTLYLSHRIFFLILFATIYTEGIGQFVIKDILVYSSFVMISILLCYILYLFTERYTNDVKRFIKNRL